MAVYGRRGTIYEDPPGYRYGQGYGPAPALYGPGDPYYEEYYEKPMPQVQTVAVMPEPMMSFPPPMPEPVVYMSPRVASPQPPARPKQRKWSICPFLLGMVLLVCGMVMVALCFYMAQLPEKALKKTCETLLPKRAGCKTTTSAPLLTTAPLLKTSAYTLKQCKLDLYVAWGCKCKDAAAGASCVSHEDLTCKEAGFSYYLAGLYERWETGMWMAGGLGFLLMVLFVIIPAFKASISGSISLVVFSTCSGLFCLPFLVASGFFFAIAAAFRENRMALYDTFNNMCVNAPAALESHCGTKVWCDTINEVRTGDEHQVAASAAVAGLACLIAGLCMFVGMFVCCCCKASVDEDPVPVPRPMIRYMPRQPAYEIHEPRVSMAPPLENVYEPYFEPGPPYYDTMRVRNSPTPLEALYPSLPAPDTRMYSGAG